jgi:UDP-glucose 4-epimerase
MKALVTGGAGFIGSHLVDLLVDRDVEVLVVDDLSSGSLDNLAGARRRGRVAVHVMDVQAPELRAVASRFRPEVVYHLAAQANVSRSIDDPVADAGVNVVGTVNLLEAARASGARKVVAASSAAVYGNPKRLPVTERTPQHPQSPYGVSKKVMEDYLRLYRSRYDLPYVLITPANVYGPRQDPGLEGGVVAIFVKAMLDGRRPTIYGDGGQTRDFVYVEDLVDAFGRAASAGDAVRVNAGSGTETTVIALYDLIAELTGYGTRPDFAAPRTGDIVRSVLDPSKAREALGWEPWTSLRDGLEATVEWYRGSARS